MIKVGGDFMHGRLMLPGLFAILMPVAALPLSPHRATTTLTAATIAIWVPVAATELRTPYAGTFYLSERGISDEPESYNSDPEKPVKLEQNPVTLEDHKGHEYARFGAEAKQKADRGEAVMLDLNKGLYDFPSRPGLSPPTVAFVNAIGMVSYAAGPELRVVDRYGLADPIASRLRLEQRGRPGHEKEMDHAWAIARFSDPESLLVRIPPDCGDCLQRRLEIKDRAGSARKALRCGVLRRGPRGSHRADEPVALPRKHRLRPESHRRALRPRSERCRT